jgi:catechol 2,3-dioxygenase-like lactoylglutathione lyase family enzyme
MGTLEAVEIKAFVPARDFELSKQFYQDLGCTIDWSDGDYAGLRYGCTSFLLQKFYLAAHADNFMMSLMVRDVAAWWEMVAEKRIVERYGVRAEVPADRPWGMRDFALIDPTGVLWRIGQNFE